MVGFQLKKLKRITCVFVKAFQIPDKIYNLFVVQPINAIEPNKKHERESEREGRRVKPHEEIYKINLIRFLATSSGWVLPELIFLK